MTKKQRKIFYPTIFILGIFSMVLQVVIYRNTIIELSILIGIILVVGIISFLLDFKNYRKTYKYSGIGLYFYSSMHYVCGFGFLACTIFMLTNYYLADEKTTTQNHEIIDRTFLPKRPGKAGSENKPVFVINYKGKRKELVFNPKFYEKMELYKSVEFEIRDGFFGFDILKNKKLKIKNDN